MGEREGEGENKQRRREGDDSTTPVKKTRSRCSVAALRQACAQRVRPGVHCAP